MYFQLPVLIEGVGVLDIFVILQISEYRLFKLVGELDEDILERVLNHKFNRKLLDIIGLKKRFYDLEVIDSLVPRQDAGEEDGEPGAVLVLFDILLRELRVPLLLVHVFSESIVRLLPQ